MSFIKRIKDDLFNTQKGIREKVYVNRKDLDELVHHFQQLDSEARANHSRKDIDQIGVWENLHLAIVSAFHKSKNSVRILIVLMDTLQELIKENEKENEIKKRL